MSDGFLTQDTSEFNVIFIHSKLDDVGLSASEFRIYSHLSRRANSLGRAWPGINSMAEVCKMNRKTVMDALEELESRKMIKVHKEEGKRSIYRLTAPSEWVVRNRERSVNQSEIGNGPVRNEERYQSEIGNRRISKEGDPEKEAPSQAKKPATKGRVRQTDDEFIASLKTEKAYQGIDIDRELGKCMVWCKTHRKECTQARFVNWLNKADKPITTSPKIKRPTPAEARAIVERRGY